MDKEAKTGAMTQIKVSEALRGREMGGVVFNLQHVSPRTFMQRRFREAAVFFKALAKQFDIPGAGNMAALFEKAHLEIHSGKTPLKTASLEKFSRLMPGIVSGLSGKLTRDDLRRFDGEMKMAGSAVNRDWEAFTNHLEAGMVAAKPLFMKRVAK